jgi:plastocyanin
MPPTNSSLSRASSLACSFRLIVALLVAACAQAAEPIATPPTDTETAAAALDPCSAALAISLIQTPVPVTPTPTAEGPSASPTPRPATATPRPAPQTDRVGFPEGFEDNYKLMFVYDRHNNRQVRVVCGNDVAASVQPGQPFPHGSVLVMTTWRAKVDADGKLVTDENGHFIRESLAGIFVMRKEPGFGTDYEGLRTGEWEYVAYRPDGSHLTPPEQTANCAACHVGAGEDRDWVFRANDIFFQEGRFAAAPVPGENEIAMNSISFAPRTLKVAKGTTLRWVNHDVVPHTMTSNDNAINSGVLDPGDDFSFTFETAGIYEYHCSLHPEQMQATIEVTD